MRLLIALIAVLAALAAGASPASAATPPIRHVFVIVLENESASTTFGPSSPAPYLAHTLTSEGAYLPDYHGIGHESNDNYIAMISGQAPNAENQADCQIFANFPLAVTGAYGQQEGEGCVYPAGIQTIGGQLDAAGLTWRDYNQSMGDTPTRESATCGHPALNSRDGTQAETAQDAYATRHDPFVYFHSVIDNAALCRSHVVNLDELPGDLAGAATTPSYVFITPDLCSDGHDATCADPSRPGGYAGIEQFLKQWVAEITGSPAFQQGNGLLLITFDEASTSDTSSCCGEIPGPGSPQPGISGPGGGDVGAVMLSPCIKPGTVSNVAYDHYTMLRSVEDIFGLAHLGYAGLPGGQAFGSDVFTDAAACSAPPVVAVSVPARCGPSIRLSWRTGAAAPRFAVQVRRLHPVRRWRPLRSATRTRSLRFHGRRGATYQFRVRATDGAGVTGRWRTRRVRVG